MSKDDKDNHVADALRYALHPGQKAVYPPVSDSVYTAPFPWWVRLALRFQHPQISVDSYTGDYILVKRWRGVVIVVGEGRLETMP